MMAPPENSRKNTLTNLILGPIDRFQLNHLEFTAVNFCCAVIAGLMSCSDLLLDLGPRYYSVSISATIIFIYYKSRVTDDFRKFLLPFITAMFFFIFYVWFMLGGITGVYLLIALSFSAIIPIIVEGKSRYFVLFVLFLAVTFMCTVEIDYPGFIFAQKNRTSRLLDLYTSTVLLGIGLVLYFSLVMRSHKNQALQIKSLNRSLEKTNRLLTARNNELQSALTEIKTLQGILPICASCKKIRDDSGYWHQVEAYVQNHSEAEFSHSLCPDCARKLYPDLHEEDPS